MSQATPATAAAPAVTAPVATTPAAPSSMPAPEASPKVGTTTRLFSDMVGSGVPGAPKAPEAAPPAPYAPAKTETPPAAEATPADVIDIATLTGKKVTLKVGGKEEVVPVEEMVRRAQLDSHLTQKATELAEKERLIAEREKALRKPEPPAPAKPPLGESIIADDPIVKHLLEQLAATNAKFDSLNAAAAPARHEQNMRVIKETVAKSGHTDFDAFRPQLEQMFNAMPQGEKDLADNEGWWVREFQALKLKDLEAKLAAPKPPALPTRPGAPMPEIAGASAIPQRPASEADQEVRAAFQKAQASGTQDDWTEYFRLDRLAKAAV